MRRTHVFLLTLCLVAPLCAKAQDSQAAPRPSLGSRTPDSAQNQTRHPATPQRAAQSTAAVPPQGGSQGRITARTDIVIVPVTVKDGRGHLVDDLTRDDFRVLQDGVEQPITFFSADAHPISAVVLIDNDLAQRAQDQVQKSLAAISAGFASNYLSSDGSPQHDEVAIMTYDAYPELVSKFSSNNDDIFATLKRIELGSHDATIYSGPTNSGPVINGQPLPDGRGPAKIGAGRPSNDIALDDAVFAASEMLKGRGRDRRKIILLISDGTNSRHNEHTFDVTLHSLLAADVNVYSISVSRTVPLGPFGHSPLQRNTGTPQKYAADTGGDTFYASKARDLEPLYSAVTEESRNQYTLAFAAHPADLTRDFHSIEVRVDRPGLSVSAKQGYYLSAVRGEQ